jgi:sporulation protein YlmC with PRC-barrel domain
MDQCDSALIMKAAPERGRAEGGEREVRLDRLLGRQVLSGNGQPVGRLQDVRAELRGTSCIITGYVIGGSALLERLHVGVKLLFGRKSAGYLARWDQLDVSDPERPRLKCAVDELHRI